MRHQKLRRKLGIKADHRKALLRNLTKNLIRHKRIRTTVARAKEASAYFDKLVTIAKRGDLHARRLLVAKLGSADTAGKLMREIVPFLKDRQSGYTRVIRYGQRRGDGAQMALWEFTVPVEPPESKKKKEKKLSKKSEKKPDEAGETQAKKPREKGEKEPLEEKSSKAAEKEVQGPETKEAEKRGGFLGKLRKFLKGDE